MTTTARASTHGDPPACDPAAIRAHLEAVFGTAAGGYLPVWTAETKLTDWVPVTDLDRATAIIARRAADGGNVYVGLGLHPAPLGAGKRGEATGVVAIPGAWAELDFGADGHRRADLPPTRAALEAALGALPLRPTLVVESGHGLHVYWLFHEFWHFDSPAERAQSEALVRRWQRLVQRHVPMDSTADLARVLRPAGTLNRKPNLPPVPVRLVRADGPRYVPDDFDMFLPDDEPAAGAGQPEAADAEDEARRPDLARILAGCGFLRHCRDYAAALPEPEWHAMLSVVSQCRDGERLAHELSASYPGYTPTETQRKYGYARRANKPMTCATIRTERGGEPYCSVCPLAGTIKSPIVLGYARPHRRATANGADPGGTADAEENANTANPAPDEPDALPAAPPFPLEVFPAAIQAYLQAAAASVGDSPVEMVAMPFLAICGALIGNRLAIRLKHGYEQLPTLFVAIVAEPGTAKSPLLDKARWPLDRLQYEAHEAYKRACQAHEAELARWDAMPKEERAGKEKPIRPRLRHYYSTDLTVEALVAILADAPGVAIVRDEIVSWVRALDQYRGGKGADRQQYLSLWAGTSIKADRRTGESVYQPWPVAAVVGGVQPDHLADLHDRDGKRDGFIERVLPIRPEADLVPWNEDELDPSLLEPVLELLRGLDGSLPKRDGADAWTVQLHPEARAIWAEWNRDNEEATRLATGLRRGFFAKLPSHVARFALILHALKTATGDPRAMVSAETMADAVALGEFCRLHVERTLPLIGVAACPLPSGLTERVRRILRTPEQPDGWVPRSEFIRRLRNVLAVDLTAALNELRARGLAEARRIPTATKPAEAWRLTARADEDARSRNSQYSGPAAAIRGESAKSANADETRFGRNGTAPEYDEVMI